MTDNTMALKFVDTSIYTDDALAAKRWRQHLEMWQCCVRCALAYTRRSTVLGRGHIPCDMLIVGEAPGNSEDHHAAPFVGPSGHVLNKALEKLTELFPSLTYFLANTLACRPTYGRWKPNRKPNEDEMNACELRLLDIIEMTRPKVVVSAGKIAQAWLLSRHHFITPYIHIDHPSYIHRNGGVNSKEYKRWVSEWYVELKHLYDTNYIERSRSCRNHVE